MSASSRPTRKCRMTKPRYHVIGAIITQPSCRDVPGTQFTLPPSYNMVSVRRAVTPLITRSIYREPATKITRSAFTLHTVRPNAARPALRPFTSSIRYHSAPATQSRVYEFEQIRQLSESPSKERILIGKAPQNPASALTPSERYPNKKAS